MTTAEERATAQEVINELTSDPLFMTLGHRNNHAVNLCCACRVLGLDPIEWWKGYCEAEHIDKMHYDLALEHIKRIKPYAERWGTNGNEGDALKYMIN